MHRSSIARGSVPSCVAALAALLPACAGTSEAPVSAAAALLEADRAFAVKAAEDGVHAAFSSVMAEDGVFFRPAPVIAHAWLAEHPDWADTLAWEPDRAEVAGSADLGFTSGTWSARPAPGAEVSARGRYVTVWRRVRDRWEAVLDHGVPLGDGAAARHPPRVSAPLHAAPAGEEAAPSDAVALDILFAAALGEGGDEVSSLLAPDVEFLRPGDVAAGPQAAGEAFTGLRGLSAGCEGAVIARDGTLSATWGTLSAADRQFTYLRVWRAPAPGALPQLVLDLMAPVQG